MFIDGQPNALGVGEPVRPAFAPERRAGFEPLQAFSRFQAILIDQGPTDPPRPDPRPWDADPTFNFAPPLRALGKLLQGWFFC